MMQSKKIYKFFKSVFCLMIILAFAVGCADKEGSSEKKKKVIKKVVIVESDENDNSVGSAVGNDFYGDNSNVEVSDSTDKRERRELYREAEDTEYVKPDVTEPEYSLKSYEWIGPNDYVIVYGKGSRTNYSSACKIQSYFETFAGVKLNITDDTAAANEKEILVGNTNRLKSSLAENEYAVVLADSKLVFEGGHSAMVEEAVKWFVTFDFTNGKTNLISGSCKNFNTSVKENYQYVWGDEFGGNALDMSKWSFQNRMGGTNMMPTLSDSNVVNVNDGLLKLSAIRYYNASRPAAQYATNMSVSSEESMSWKYGYLEMRAMVPFNRGAWPSLWMVSDGAVGNENSKSDYFGEIDIFEIFSSVNTVTPNLHKWYNDGSHTQYNGLRESENYIYKSYNNLRYEYHIYGFEWTPEKMVMSVDGDEYMTYDLNDNFDGISDMSGFHDNYFILLNNHIYVPDLGQTTSSTEVNNRDLPFEFFIDYIRIYQKPGEGSLNFAD